MLGGRGRDCWIRVVARGVCSLGHCLAHDIIYIMRNAVMRRIRWVWLWLRSCFPPKSPDTDEIAA